MTKLGGVRGSPKTFRNLKHLRVNLLEPRLKFRGKMKHRNVANTVKFTVQSKSFF